MAELHNSTICEKEETNDISPPNTVEPLIDADSLSSAQISTRFLYPQNLPISLLAPMNGDDFTTHQSQRTDPPQQDKIQSISEVTASPVEIDGIHYNSRGYEICGQLNQHSKPCQRIGSCPFHKKEGTPVKAETPPVEKKSPIGKPPIKRGPYKRGWTKEEHILFLNGLQIHGKGAWKEISMIVQTRTPTQIQSHAQKYFLRQKQEVKNKRSIHDISLEDLSDIPPSVDHNTRVPTPQKNMNMNMSMNMNIMGSGLSMRPNFSYPLVGQDPLFLNPLVSHPLIGSHGMAPGFSMPYGTTAGTWLPQIYPFSMPLGLSSPNISDDRSPVMELHDDRVDNTLHSEHDFSDSPTHTPEDKRHSYDSFSFHSYANSLDDRQKSMKIPDSEFLFNN